MADIPSVVIDKKHLLSETTVTKLKDLFYDNTKEDSNIAGDVLSMSNQDGATVSGVTIIIKTFDANFERKEFEAFLCKVGIPYSLYWG